jgi:hypothetical protein
MLCCAVLCADGPVTSLVGLSLTAQHRRGQGAAFDAVNRGRVRRGFRHLRAKMPLLAGAPKPTRPGPGGLLGSRNRQVAVHPPVGKTQHQNTTQQSKSN